jgi:hypothetical protein
MTDRYRRLLALIASTAIAACSPAGTPTPTLSNAPPATSEPTTGSTASPVDTAASQTASVSAGLPQSSEAVTLDPSLFAGVALDNPYSPLKAGSRWVYRETDAEGTKQDVVVTVTDRTKMIIGIDATVVHDVVSENGHVVEDTLDWYAQDTLGNLWYLGEDTKEFEGGKVSSTAGSWEAGVDGAQPGIVLPAHPAVGMAYRQEYYAGQAEDAAEILNLGKHVDVPFGSFDAVLQTKETTALEPDVVEHKFYAKGVGMVESIDVSGGSSHDVLLTFKPG